MSSSLAILEDEAKLRNLADLIYLKEKNRTQTIEFQSSSDHAKYLQDCRINKETAIAILDATGPFKDKFAGVGTKSPIANDIYGYSIYSINAALQTMRNYTMRKDYLESVKNHIEAIMKDVEDLDSSISSAAEDAQRIAKEVAEYKDAMKTFLTQYSSSKSKAFSEKLKAEGTTFESLVSKYQAQLNFPGPFKDLDDTQKIQVYNKIIEASGRGGIISQEVGGVFMSVAGRRKTESFKIGTDVILKTVGSMVWDIFTAERPVREVTKDAVNGLAMVGGAALKEVVVVAARTMLSAVEMAEIFVTMAGVITSFAGTFVITTAAMFLIDLIFSSGGTAPLLTEGIHCYVAELPDGAAIARQIANTEGLLEFEATEDEEPQPAPSAEATEEPQPAPSA